jgi:hypothetical protein
MMLSMDDDQAKNLFLGRWMVRDLVLMIHPSTVFDSSKEASARNFFEEIRGFLGIGLEIETGLAIDLIAKLAALATRSKLSFKSGTTNIVSSIYMSPFPLSMIGIFTANCRAGVKGMSGGRRFGTKI